MVFISRFARTKRRSRTERRTRRNGFAWQGWYARRKGCKGIQEKKGGANNDVILEGREKCSWEFSCNSVLDRKRYAPLLKHEYDLQGQDQPVQIGFIYMGKSEYCYAQEIVLFAGQVFTKTFLPGPWVEVYVNFTLSRMLSYIWLPPAPV